MNSFKQVFILASLLAVSIFSSCRNESPVQPKSIEDLKVSPAFNWDASHEISLNISVDFTEFTGLLSKISVYDGNPLTDGQLLLTGSAGYNYPFTTTIRIPTAVNQVYFKLENPDGQKFIAQADVTNEINFTFTPATNFKSSEVVVDPDCNSGCDITVSGSSVTIKGGKTYCITSAFTGSVSFEHWNGGGTLKICSTANISSINNMGTGCAIIVTGNGVLKVNNSFSMDGNSSLTAYADTKVELPKSFNMNTSGTNLTNYSTDFTIGENFSPNGPVINYGNITIDGSFNINGSSSLSNSGEFIVSESFNANKNVTNTGLIEVGETCNLNSNIIVVNDCQWIIHKSLNINPAALNMNHGYLSVGETISLNSGTLNLSNQSMVVAKHVNLNSNITGAGSLNSVKSNTATINSGKVIGAVEYATQTGTMSNYNASKFTNGASLVSWANITNYIPTGECNPEGIGENPVSDDADGDGVTDDLDDYPNDPDRAFDNYYPGKGQYCSFAFEDLWPSKGDYDMNDLVADCNYWYVTNAQNKVIDINPTIYIRANGASLENGFGFQLNGVVPAVVESVSGNRITENYVNIANNGTELNQSKTVIIVSDNLENVIHRVGGTFYNTENNDYYGFSDTLKIRITLADPQLQSAVGTPPYNPFLIKDQNRPIEIHLPDMVPTDLMDMGLFGTGDDDSDPVNGRYYKSATNLPWGIAIPQKFDYTWELTQIVYGHLMFGAWAESDGQQYPDWYKNLSGYRDNSMIYFNEAAQ